MTYAAMLLGDPEYAAYRANSPAHWDNHPELKVCLNKEDRARNPEKYRQWGAIYYAGHRSQCIARVNMRHRSLGFNPLNSWFVGCEGHHINQSDVIYIPRAMHKSVWHNVFTGKNMDKINALAGAFLTEDWT